MKKMSAGGELSSARRQREWLDAIDTKTEAEVKAQRANEALEEAEDDVEKKRIAFLESSNPTHLF